jgi:heat shock protein 90kDa beta
LQEAEKVKPVMKTETESGQEWEQQNKNKPIWTRPPKEVTDDEYNNFFTTTFREFVPPMARSHFNVEGTYEFAGLLFVPGMAPFDAFQRAENERKSSIRMFVKRVFISDQFDEQLLPKYLSFIKGIVDSSDLPLNVSREILQVRTLAVHADAPTWPQV